VATGSAVGVATVAAEDSWLSAIGNTGLGR